MTSLGVYRRTEANCWGVVEAVEDWSLLHSAAGPEESPAADVEENALSLQLLHLHLPSAGTDGGGGAEVACHCEQASHLAAVAVELQFQGPFLAAGLEEWSESESGELAVGFLQMLGYWVLWCCCFPVMGVLPQVLLVAPQLAAPPSACWPFFSSTFEPDGACAAAAAAGASA